MGQTDNTKIDVKQLADSASAEIYIKGKIMSRRLKSKIVSMLFNHKSTEELSEVKQVWLSNKFTYIGDEEDNELKLSDNILINSLHRYLPQYIIKSVKLIDKKLDVVGGLTIVPTNPAIWKWLDFDHVWQSTKRMDFNTRLVTAYERLKTICQEELIPFIHSCIVNDLIRTNSDGDHLYDLGSLTIRWLQQNNLLRSIYSSEYLMSLNPSELKEKISKYIKVWSNIRESRQVESVKVVVESPSPGIVLHTALNGFLLHILIDDATVSEIQNSLIFREPLFMNDTGVYQDLVDKMVSFRVY